MLKLGNTLLGLVHIKVCFWFITVRSTWQYALILIKSAMDTREGVSVELYVMFISVMKTIIDLNDSLMRLCIDLFSDAWLSLFYYYK